MIRSSSGLQTIQTEKSIQKDETGRVRMNPRFMEYFEGLELAEDVLIITKAFNVNK